MNNLGSWTAQGLFALSFLLLAAVPAAAQSECEALSKRTGDLCLDYCEDLDCDGAGFGSNACERVEAKLLDRITPTGLTSVSCSDIDQDGTSNSADNCSETANAGQEDTDGDGIGDECDNCVDVFNPDQHDYDADGTGDLCTAPAPPSSAECPCFGLAMARLMVQQLQPGISSVAPSNEYCISQPGIVGQVHAGFSNFTNFTNLGVVSASVFSNLQTGALQCYVFVRHVNDLKDLLFGGVTTAERDACVAVMEEAIALDDVNNRCNKQYP